jgi:outer membrane lipoprotein-sorting protein
MAILGRSRHTRCAAALSILFSLLCCANIMAAELEEILAGFDKAQESFTTLSADFVQTTTNPMLKDPVVAEGRFYMTKPDAIRWEYSTPEEMSFVITKDRYTGYYPERKRAEKKNVQRYSKQIFRYFGLGQGSAQLARYYDIRLIEDERVRPETYLLSFEPKKRRARKRVEEVLFWIDDSTFLPVRVEYHGQSGSTRVVEFKKIRLNPELAANLYTMTIPEDCTVTTGFGGMGGLNPDESR